MKKIIRWFTASRYELFAHWKMMGLFFIIFVIVFSALISITSMSVVVPEKMNEFSRDGGWAEVDITSFLTTDEVSDLEKMDVWIVYCMSTLYSVYIDQNETIMNCFFVDKKGKNLGVIALTDGLLEGRVPETDDNNKQVMWIPKKSAKEYGWKVGDFITLKNLGDETMDFEVVGICRDDYIDAPHISAPGLVFFSSLDEYEFDDKWQSITVFPESVTDYYKVRKDIKRKGYKMIGEDTYIKSLLLIDYSLYSTVFFLLLLTGYVMVSLTRMYYNRRVRFYSVMKIMGMGRGQIYVTICGILSAVAGVAFLVALFLAPFMNRYVTDVIHELVEDIDIQPSVMSVETLALFATILVLVWLSGLVSRWTLREKNLAAVLHQSNE